jgi:hypothetical protein
MENKLTVADLLIDGYGRIREVVTETVTGLTPQQLAFQPDPESNSIGWLVWHLTRLQDDHIAGVAGSEQLWTADGWYERFELPFDRSEMGYGQRPEQVAAVRISSAQLLLDYHLAVFERSREYLAGLDELELTRVVDDSWDPPVTLGVRLVSVLSDDLQHAGQAAYLKGLLARQS